MAFLGILAAMAACRTTPAPTVDTDASSPVKRGEYLVSVLGCDDCHTTKTMTASGPAPDMSRRLAGHWADPGLPAPPKLPEGPWGVVTTMSLTAWSGPWGVSYAINLTPDEETGIGVWTEDAFVKGIRTGKHMGVGRPILPPMPWMDFAHLTDGDLKAVFAYLKSLPPVKNLVPNPVIATPPSP
jgi:hypothetical protein